MSLFGIPPLHDIEIVAPDHIPEWVRYVCSEVVLKERGTVEWDEEDRLVLRLKLVREDHIKYIEIAHIDEVTIVFRGEGVIN